MSNQPYKSPSKSFKSNYVTNNSNSQVKHKIITVDTLQPGNVYTRANNKVDGKTFFPAKLSSITVDTNIDENRPSIKTVWKKSGVTQTIDYYYDAIFFECDVYCVMASMKIGGNKRKRISKKRFLRKSNRKSNKK